MQIFRHIVDKCNLIFFQGLFAADAVRQKNGLVRRADSDHIKEMPLQGDCFQFFWKAGIGNLFCLAVLSQQEFVAKIFAGIAAVQKRRLQNGESGKAASMPAAKIGQPVCCCRYGCRQYGLRWSGVLMIPFRFQPCSSGFSGFCAPRLCRFRCRSGRHRIPSPDRYRFWRAFDIKCIFADLMKLKHMRHLFHLYLAKSYHNFKKPSSVCKTEGRKRNETANL